MNKYIVVSSKDWFSKHKKSNQFKKLNVIEILNKKKLNIKNLRIINPKYIFFIHWNEKVSEEIYKNFKCIVFHTSPLPFGRGGSPIQNLIIRGIKNSPVCAIKMTKVIDGGPVYDSMNITLNGTISEIFLRIAKKIEKLIIKICKNNPKPLKQEGKVVKFSRLKNKDNKILDKYSIKEIYDRIRMVDGEGYERAYIKFGNYKLELSNSTIKNKKLLAKIKLYRSDS